MQTIISWTEIKLDSERQDFGSAQGHDFCLLANNNSNNNEESKLSGIR